MTIERAMQLQIERIAELEAKLSNVAKDSERLRSAALDVLKEHEDGYIGLNDCCEIIPHYDRVEDKFKELKEAANAQPPT